MSFVLPMSHHLKNSHDYGMVLKSRRVHKASMYSLWWRDNELEYSRIGFIVSRKVGGAVVRNTWRRRWKEAFRLERQDFKSNCDLVVQMRPKAQMMKVDEMQQALRERFA